MICYYSVKSRLLNLPALFDKDEKTEKISTLTRFLYKISVMLDGDLNAEHIVTRASDGVKSSHVSCVLRRTAATSFRTSKPSICSNQQFEHVRRPATSHRATGKGSG